MKKTKSDIAWYAIRVTYSRELKLKEYLDSQQIENFVPMHYDVVEKENKLKRKLVPVIHNLIFIHSTKAIIDSVKQINEGRFPMRYIIDHASNSPVVVPEKEMKHFMTVVSSYHDDLIFLDSGELTMKKGDKVRITTGIWAGVEGVFIRVKGDRRVVVSLRGIMAVATAFVHPSCLEKIN